MTRREFLASAAAAARPAGGLRLAVCNETFQNTPFPEMCRLAKRTGYTGLEIAPFTLGDDRAEARRAMEGEGIAFVGLHNLLTAPAGLRPTAPDAATRRKAWEHLLRLVEVCAELGPNGVMVFGSGKQRAADTAADVEDATRRLENGLAWLAEPARRRGVTIVLEPLAPHLTNVVTTLAEAAAIVRRIGSPAVQTMFDTHAAVKETLPHGDLVRKFFPYLRHVHVNEMDGRRPGAGDYDFKPVLQALKDLAYPHWVSLEVFDFKEGGEKLAAEASRYLRARESELR